MLKIVLVANAASCLGFGAIFAALPNSTAQFLGNPPEWLVLVIGVGLILNGLNLLRVARHAMPGRFDVLQFALGDALWVAVTLVLVALGIWITTIPGIIAALGVAAWVAACGIAQYVLLPEPKVAENG